MHFVAKDLKTTIIYVITCALIQDVCCTIMFTILLIRINTLIVEQVYQIQFSSRAEIVGWLRMLRVPARPLVSPRSATCPL